MSEPQRSAEGAANRKGNGNLEQPNGQIGRPSLKRLRRGMESGGS